MNMQEKIKATYDIVKTAVIILLGIIAWLVQGLVADIKNDISVIKVDLKTIDNTNKQQDADLKNLRDEISKQELQNKNVKQ